MEKDQEFVEYVVRALVNSPDDVRAERTVDEMGVLITIFVAQDDKRYVIGRKGQNAQALRTLLRVVGAKNNARVNLKIYEPEEERQARFAKRDAERPLGEERPNQGPRPQAPAAPSPMEEDIDTSAVDDLRI